MGSPSGLGSQRLHDDGLRDLEVETGLASRARGILLDARETEEGESAPPETDGAGIEPTLLHDLRVGLAVHGIQHDASSLDETVGGGPATRPGEKLLAFLWRESDEDSDSHGRGPARPDMMASTLVTTHWVEGRPGGRTFAPSRWAQENKWGREGGSLDPLLAPGRPRSSLRGEVRGKELWARRRRQRVVVTSPGVESRDAASCGLTVDSGHRGGPLPWDHPDGLPSRSGKWQVGYPGTERLGLVGSACPR